jgi:hypothetical protein
MPTFSRLVIPGAIQVPGTQPHMGLKINESMEIVGSNITEDGLVYSIGACEGCDGRMVYTLNWMDYSGEFDCGGCCGVIMVDDEYPDIAKYVVSQIAPGLYTKTTLSGIRADLAGVVHDVKDPIEFAERLTYVLSSVGYKKPNNAIKTKSINIGTIMSEMRELIVKTNVKHKTEHMQTIFRFMDMLWMAL